MGKASSTNSVEKVCGVLRAVGAAGGMRLIDIAEQTGLNKSSALRVLKALTDEGFVQRGEGGFTYELGSELISVVGLNGDWQKLLTQANESLIDLAERSGDTASLAIRSGLDVTFVAKVVGSYPVQAGLEMGARMHIAYANPGIAMLARMSEREQDWALQYLPPPPTGFSARQVKRDEVENYVKQAREHGYAYSEGRVLEGVSSLSVAILGNGAPVAGLTISSTTGRIASRIDELSALLLSAADDIHAEMSRKGRQQAEAQ
jgi:DNA-binding IclR family transcriptional regulator